MDFICITHLEIETMSPDIQRTHTINQITHDLVKVIETPTAIPFELFGHFTMCGIQYVVIDIKRKIEINSEKNRVEHITTVILSYPDDEMCIEDKIPF